MWSCRFSLTLIRLLECVSAPVYCMQCVLGQGWETKTHIKYREGEKFGLMSSLGRIYYLL